MPLTENQTRAIALIDDFRTHTVNVWPNLTRAAVADGLVVRVTTPSTISSRYSSLCGAASMMFQLATNDPEGYVKAAVGLYDTGQATVRSLVIKPSSTFRATALPAGNDAADWLMLGSLRDSENWLFTYKETGHWWDDLKAIQMPHTVAEWMRKFGYSDVQNETNLAITKGWDNVVEANGLYDRGYKVSLFINSDMLKIKTQENFSVLADHWVGMASKATSSAIHADPNARLSLSVYSWGAIQTVPENPTSKPMHPKVFLRNYYGYVAGKP